MMRQSRTQPGDNPFRLSVLSVVPRWTKSTATLSNKGTASARPRDRVVEAGKDACLAAGFAGLQFRGSPEAGLIGRCGSHDCGPPSSQTTRTSDRLTKHEERLDECLIWRPGCAAPIGDDGELGPELRMREQPLHRCHPRIEHWHAGRPRDHGTSSFRFHQNRCALTGAVVRAQHTQRSNITTIDAQCSIQWSVQTAWVSSIPRMTIVWAGHSRSRGSHSLCSTLKRCRSSRASGRGGPYRGPDPVQSQPANRVRAGRQQR